jgi:hypothetical protein
VNSVCAGKIADSEVDKWLPFQVENVLHLFGKFSPQLSIETIRVDQTRKFLVVSVHLVFSG